MTKTIDSYGQRVTKFVSHMAEIGLNQNWRTEFMFESLSDESLFGNADELYDWYLDCVKANKMTSEMIPLHECRQWSVCAETGSIVHDSGEFFRVDGIRVSETNSREVKTGWDQPVLTQVGYDGGILGLLRKRFSGVPHYLIEAKAEPGNYNVVQITSTIQATFSNLKRAHKGSATNYSEIFLNPEKYQAMVIIDQWMSEDGGRLFNKRNRTMLVEVPEHEDIEMASGFYRWVSLHQLKQLLLEKDAIVAPHVRGILACV